MRLKSDELELYGDPLTPEYVYDTIRHLPRFDNMKRGSQEDAEEFLGFLLAGLHDDCAHVIKKSKADAAQNGTSPKTERSNSADAGWLEVTAKQKTAYEIGVRLVGSEMCIRDRSEGRHTAPARQTSASSGAAQPSWRNQ